MRLLNVCLLFIYVNDSHLAVTNTIDRNRNEYVMEVQCRAKCLKMHPSPCTVDDCLVEMQKARKYGSCPRQRGRELASNETMLYLEHNCIDACGNWDYNCSDAEKCCPHSCGSVCERPTDLDKIKALPPTPSNLSLMETQFRTVELCWNVYTSKNKTLFFVIEGRLHVGTVFAAHKLGEWVIFNGYPRYDHVFRENRVEIARRCCFLLKVKQGRWYQFRVASFNENGTRGYSKPSEEFQLKDGELIMMRQSRFHLYLVRLSNLFHELWALPAFAANVDFTGYVIFYYYN